MTRRRSFTLLISLLALTLLGQTPTPEIDWIPGPTTVDLGQNLAQLEVPSGYIFLNPEDTRELMSYIGNITDDSELGLIKSDATSEDWFVIFEYDPIGYVPDDEGDKLDSEAILQSIVNATEEANAIRVEQGGSAIHIVGWDQEPHYDQVTHNLVWSILGQSDRGQVVNFSTRLLGRRGVMSASLVASPSNVDSAKDDVAIILSEITWKQGNSYSEYIQGDRIAEIGLTALVAGGAGAVLVKTGLLAKLWKFIAVGAIAIFGVFAKIFKSLFGKVETQ